MLVSTTQHVAAVLYETGKPEGLPMPKAHICNGELRIALSDEMRAKLAVQEGEELEAHVFAGSVTFTRRTEAARRQAGARILELIGQVRVRPGQPELSPEQAEQMIDEEVKRVRRARRSRPLHD